MPRKRSPADSNGNADGVVQEAVLSRSDRNDPGLNSVKRLFHKPNRQTLEHLRERVRQILAFNSAIRMPRP